MVQITAIIEDDILDKLDIEASKSGISRSKQVAACVRAYFEPKVNKTEIFILEKEIESLNKILIIKEEQIKDLRDQNNDFIRLLSQEQALHLQTQKLLPENSDVQFKSRIWWKFWKK